MSYTIILFNAATKKRLNEYQSTIVPLVGDYICLSKDWLVEKRVFDNNNPTHIYLYIS